MWQRGYESLLEGYEAEHRRRGTRILHLIALPLMASAVLILFFSLRWAVAALAVGWTLQVLSHTFIEHNDQCLRSSKRLLLAGLWGLGQWRAIAQKISSRTKDK